MAKNVSGNLLHWHVENIQAQEVLQDMTKPRSASSPPGGSTGEGSFCCKKNKTLLEEDCLKEEDNFFCKKK